MGYCFIQRLKVLDLDKFSLTATHEYRCYQKCVICREMDLVAQY